MPLARGARLGLGLVGIAGLLAAGGLAVMMAPSDPRGAETSDGGDSSPRERATVASSSEGRKATDLEGRAARLAAGDSKALATLTGEILSHASEETDESAIPSPILEEELPSWLEDLAGLSAGFSRFGPVERAQVIQVVSNILDLLTVTPVPDRWIEALTPSAEILTIGLADASPAVKAASAEVLGRSWSWQPGTAIWPDAERIVASWKNRLHSPLVTLLDDAEPGVRLSAVLALGKLPIDAMAAPAVSRVHDPVPAVRVQVLNSYAHRRDLLTDDDILPLLYDSEQAVALAAQIVLRARGLDDELIGLAKLLYHPRADLRASAIPLIDNREDIDPIVWLVLLSRDEDESVRSQAMEALCRRASPDARRRVAEMANTDPSPSLRDAARKALDDLTADLPPLPGSPDVFPRAN